MPKINVYLPDDLAEAVKAASIPVSSVCQRALEQALQTAGAVRESVRRPPGDGGIYGRLTDRARHVLTLAAGQARQHGHHEVGSVHLLLAMLDEGGNLGIHVLAHLGVDPADVRAEVEGVLAAGPSDTDPPPERPHLAASAKRVIEQAMNESLKLGHNYIGCEHLLLALVADEGGIAGQILRTMGVELTVTRRAVQTLLAAAVHAPARPPAASVALQEILARLDRLERRLAG
ncbi:MAG: Clp protease N-terminal domain-containing protein [Acidimicrobiales bacterium]